MRHPLILVPLLLALLSCEPAPQATRYTVGIVTWIGYGPLYIARDRGFFRDEGLNVQIRVMDGPGEREAAYSAGNLDFFPNTLDALAIAASTGLRGSIVMPLDESQGADGIVVREPIKSVSDLRGRTIGFQTGITSHFFLLYLLSRARVLPTEITQVHMGAGEAGAAFVAGKLDGAVTWEPWLTKARQLRGARVLATSAETPDLLVDSLMVSQRLAHEKRRDVVRFAHAWWRAVNYLYTHNEEARASIAKAFNLEPADMEQMLRGVHFYVPEEAMRYFGSQKEPGKAFQTFDLAAALYKRDGIISNLPRAKDYIEPSILRDAAANMAKPK